MKKLLPIIICIVFITGILYFSYDKYLAGQYYFVSWHNPRGQYMFAFVVVLLILIFVYITLIISSLKMSRTEKEIKNLEEVLDLLIEKKNYFSKQLIITSDADAKFGLQQKLKELEKEIAQYKAEADQIAAEVISKNNATISGNGNIVIQGVEYATVNVSVVNNLTEKFEKLDKEVKEMQAEKTSILLEADKQRIADIKQQLIRMNKLKSEWEEKEMLTDNPKEKMQAEIEIEKLKKKMEEVKKELSSLG
jgi:hypothetical protein